jgi:hypothetical protein
MDNPAGYLYRVGKHHGIRSRRHPARLPQIPQSVSPWIEPALPGALNRPSEKQ